MSNSIFNSGLQIQSQEEQLALLEALKRGDEKAFETLVHLYSGRLFQLAYSILNSKTDAEEVVQDTFVSVYRNIATFRNEAGIGTWLYRITMNLARNRYHWNRRRGEGQTVSLSETPSDPDSAPQDIEFPDSRRSPDLEIQRKELENNILEIINMMPQNYKEVFILRHGNRMSYEEIAHLLHCRVGTVKSRIARARDFLREKLKENGAF